MEHVGIILLFIGVVCYPSHGDATCTTAEGTALIVCTDPFTVANSAAFSGIANQANCPMAATVDCASWSTGVTCINALTVTNACRLTIPTQFLQITQSFSTDCTVTHMATYCPTAPALNIGSPSSRPVACMSITVGAIACLLLLFI